VVLIDDLPRNPIFSMSFRTAIPAVILLAAASRDLQAQCVTDRISSPGGSNFAHESSLSGDWLALASRTPTQFRVHLHSRAPSGRWDLVQTITSPATPATPARVALDGERMVISIDQRLQFYTLQSGSWVAVGAPTIVTPPIIDLDYDHPWVIYGNPFFDASFIYLNGRIGVLQVEDNGSMTHVYQQAGFPLDQLLGASVAVDGDRVVYGAPGYDGFGKSDKGHVFTRDLPAGPIEKLYDPLPTSFPDDFGHAVALSGDLMAVSDFKGDFSIDGEVGKVQAFRRVAGSWVHEATLTPPPNWTGFGFDLELDGVNLLVSMAQWDAGLGALEVRYQLYQRLADQWFLRTEFSEPENPIANFNAEVDGQVVVTTSELYGTPGNPPGSAWVWSIPANNCPGQIIEPESISLSAGGVVDLVSSFAPLAAGELCFVIGSLSGTSPGLTLNGVTIPLVVDAYTVLTLELANQGPFSETFGLLDSLGGRLSRLVVPPGTAPALAGQQLHHVSLGIDPISLAVKRSSAATQLGL
jgi:hypothetical protein